MSNIINRSIPDNIKLVVRKRCGFGCIICGSPIIQYHHIEQWAQVKYHNSENITLLCPSHHMDVTAKRISSDVIISYNKNPYCIVNKISSPYTIYFTNSGSYSIDIGTIHFTSNQVNDEISQLTPIMIDDMRLIQFVKIHDKLGLFINFFDTNNRLILKITNNELVYSVGQWDITFIGDTLTIKLDKNNLLCVLKFKTPNRIIITKANLFYNGKHIKTDENGIINKNVHLSGFTIESNVGIGIGTLPKNIHPAIYIDN